MIARTEDEQRRRPATPPVAPDDLPYRIELWQIGEGAGVERVLARAFSATLAQAIYKAAQTEHPERRITVCRGETLITDSAMAARG